MLSPARDDGQLCSAASSQLRRSRLSGLDKEPQELGPISAGANKSSIITTEYGVRIRLVLLPLNFPPALNPPLFYSESSHGRATSVTCCYSLWYPDLDDLVFGNNAASKQATVNRPSRKPLESGSTNNYRIPKVLMRNEQGLIAWGTTLTLPMGLGG